MFPEYRDLITQLKTTDAHFARLFDKHNALDQKIRNMETPRRTRHPRRDRDPQEGKAPAEGPVLCRTEEGLRSLNTRPQQAMPAS
jgi:hypothetical protein